MTILVNQAYEQPFTQRIVYGTDIITGFSGVEQRISTLPKPRTSIEARLFIDDEDIHRFYRAALFQRIGDDWQVPLRSEPVVTDTSVTGGATSLSGDFSTFDDLGLTTHYVETPDGTTYETIAVSSVGASSLSLSSPLVGDYPAGSRVYPLYVGKIRDSASIERAAVNVGLLRFTLDRSGIAELGGAGATVNTYDSLPLMELRPLNESSVSEAHSEKRLRADAGAIFAEFRPQDNSAIGHQRVWRVSTKADLQYLKAFLDDVKGRQKTWLMSTWRDDLELDSQPGIGASTIDVTNDTDYNADWWPDTTHRRLSITTAAGVIQRSINSVTPGSPTTITLDSALPATADGSTINQLSFLEQVRFATDEFEIRHSNRGSVMSAPIVTTLL